MMGKKDDHQSGEMKKAAEKRKAVMKMLDLTEAQKNDLKKMHAEMKNKMDALEKEQTITVKEYNDRKTALKKEMDSKRDQILTKEQKDKIASMKANREKEKKKILLLI
jgi:primosomal protein N'